MWSSSIPEWLSSKYDLEIQAFPVVGSRIQSSCFHLFGQKDGEAKEIVRTPLWGKGMNLKGDLIGEAPILDRTGHMDPTEWERNDDDMPKG